MLDPSHYDEFEDLLETTQKYVGGAGVVEERDWNADADMPARRRSSTPFDPTDIEAAIGSFFPDCSIIVKYDCGACGCQLGFIFCIVLEVCVCDFILAISAARALLFCFAN